MSQTPSSNSSSISPSTGSDSSSGSKTPGSDSSSGSKTPGSDSTSGSPSPPPPSPPPPSPPPYQGSMFSHNGSSPTPPHVPPFQNKQAPEPSSNTAPASPATPPPGSESSPPSSPPPAPQQSSPPPSPTPSTPPPPQETTTPQVSPPPAPISTVPPPSSPSLPVTPPQPTLPPSFSSPPAQQLSPPTTSPPTDRTPVVPTPFSPPSPAGSGLPTPTFPSPPGSTTSPPVSNPTGSSPTPTNSTSSSTSPTGTAPTRGSESSSSTSGSTPRSSSPPSPHSHSTNSPTTSTSTIGIAIAGAVVGVLIMSLIAILFFLCKRKKKSVGTFAPQYIPPNTFSQADGYYYGQAPQSKESFYASQMQPSPMATGSYGSQRTNGYSGGAYSGGGISGGGYSGTDSDVIGGGKSFFSYEEAMEITNGFSRQNVIGEGGFGCVYKGQLPDGKLVAVKQLKAGSGQGDREFRAEVEIISRVHHRHLVSLVGYSIAEEQRLLIYEFLPNKTLEHHLHGKDMPVLDWCKRVKIALGSAKGLAYLHEDCHPKIIHRDIKSSNILLDNAFEAQVADFGLAKITMDSNTHVSTRVMGTFGYLAPEYATSGKLTDRSDVFSFGVVLLELITGRKPVDPSQPLGEESLVEWARPILIYALETGDFSELVDPRLEKHYVESELIRMIEAAAACIRHNSSKRPRMAQVVRALDNETEMSDLTNGVKFGQSTVYDSGQYNEDIKRFNRMAVGADDSSDYGTYSSDYTSREVPSETTQTSWKSRETSEYTSGELETRAINPERRTRMGQEYYGNRRFK